MCGRCKKDRDIFRKEYDYSLEMRKNVTQLHYDFVAESAVK